MALAGLLLATATACTTGGDSSPDTGGTDQPAPFSSTPTTKNTGPVRGIAQTWRPRLQNLADAVDASHCQQPSTTGCGQTLDHIMTTVDELSAALEEAGAEASYPKTVAEIAKLDGAQAGYRAEDCEGDPRADADGSPCFRHALEVTMGPTMLDLSLATDEPGPIPED